MLGRKAKKAVKAAEDRLQHERLYWSKRLEESNRKHQQNTKALVEVQTAMELILGSIVETFGKDGEVFLPKPDKVRAEIKVVDGGYMLCRKAEEKTEN